jgi:hypothetical protein
VTASSGNARLIGVHLIVHDEDKMMRGEPCTALYRVGTKKRPVDVLEEYQFAGDSEGHGVPIGATLVSDRMTAPMATVCAR